jgi:hypothetical protein
MGLEQEAMARDSILQQQLATVPQAKGEAAVEAADVGRRGDRGGEGLGGSERISRPVGGIRPVVGTSWEAWRQEGMG